MSRRAAVRWFRLALLLIALSALWVADADPAPAAHLRNNFEPTQCTWWVVHRLQQTGAGEAADIIITWPRTRHAFEWLERARTSGWSDGTEPRIGAIAWWPASRYPDYGHVAYVEEVLGVDRFRVSEQNYPKVGDPPQDDRVLSVSSEVAQGTRFIYPPSSAKPSPEDLAVTRGLALDPAVVEVGHETTARFTLMNQGSFPRSLSRLGVSVRGPHPATLIFDFDFATQVVIAANGTFEFASSRSFPQPGTYRMNIWMEALGRGEIPRGAEPGIQVEASVEVLSPNGAPVAALLICAAENMCAAVHQTLTVGGDGGDLGFNAVDGTNLSYDPDDDPLEFKWLINGNVVSIEPSFRFDPRALNSGKNDVLLRVSDIHSAVTEIGATIVVTEETSEAAVATIEGDPGSGSFQCEGYTVTWSNPVEMPLEELPQDASISILDTTGAAVFEQSGPSYSPLRFTPGWCGHLLGNGTVVVGYTEFSGGANCCWAAHAVTPSDPERVLIGGNVAAIAGNTTLNPVQLDGSGPLELTGTSEVLRYQFFPGYVGPITPLVLAYDGTVYVEATRRFSTYLRDQVDDRLARLGDGSFEERAARAIEAVAVYALLDDAELGLREVRSRVADDVAGWLDANASAALEIIDATYRS